MYPSSFDYRAPTTLEEVSRLLTENDVKLIAGGQSLLPMLRLRLVRPKLVVDLARIPGLSYIRQQSERLQLGAMTTQAEIEDNVELVRQWPWLVETAASIGDRQIRNLGTIGGTLAHADPSADWAAMVLAADAMLEVYGTNGRRAILAEEFLRSAYETALNASEVVTSIIFPARQQPTSGAYRKFRHPASGYAVAGAAVVVSLEADGRLSNVRVGVTGVASIAYRARFVELALEGEPAEQDRLVAAAARAAHGVEPLADTFADAEFRGHLAALVTERALVAALERVRRSTSARM
jgi:carbon-monoxide dehydrogenase medium subunit